jgi:hypothetical protein
MVNMGTVRLGNNYGSLQAKPSGARIMAIHSVIAGLETLKVPLTAQSLFTKGAYSS